MSARLDGRGGSAPRWRRIPGPAKCLAAACTAAALLAACESAPPLEEQAAEAQPTSVLAVAAHPVVVVAKATPAAAAIVSTPEGPAVITAFEPQATVQALLEAVAEAPDSKAPPVVEAAAASLPPASEQQQMLPFGPPAMAGAPSIRFKSAPKSAGDEAEEQLKEIERGTASWYGLQFHGRRTANGERYDMYALTAAHKTLPFNTIVRVHNLRTGRSVQVRINDRGPFVKGRVIDLSKAAAEKLGMDELGLRPVSLTVAEWPDGAKEAAQAGEGDGKKRRQQGAARRKR